MTGLLTVIVLTTASLKVASAVTTISQLGNEILGEAAGDYSGRTVTMSSDGTHVAIGEVGSDANGTDSGQVRIYNWNGTTWTQLGTDIDGEAANDYSGSAVAMSTDGTRIAIGSDANGAYRGHVRIYNWNGTAWTQLGNDIDGEASSDQFGKSVAMSSDGTHIAIGAPGNDGINGADSGHVRIYNWNGTAWTQVGNDIDGEASGDLSGRTVAMSSDGTRIAIGAPQNDGNGTDSGHVRVYSWDGTAWTQLGTDIDGEAIFNNFGFSMTMSSDGTHIAIGTPFNSGNGGNAGHVRIYNWNGTAWTQVGNDIDGEAANDYSGTSVAMSSDGARVAIGARLNDGGGDAAGHVRIFDWNGTAWTQVGNDIDGEAIGDQSGQSVAMSSNGTRVAVGAPYNDDTNKIDAGQVRVYTISTTLSITYDSQGGSAVSDGDTSTTRGGSITTLPTNPTRDGHSFTGWYTAISGGTQITTATPHGQTTDFTLYARWSANTVPTSTTSTVLEGNAQPTSSTVPSAKLPDTGTNSHSWINVALILIALGILTRFRAKHIN